MFSVHTHHPSSMVHWSVLVHSAGLQSEDNHNQKQSWLCDIDQQNILLITFVDHLFAWYLKSCLNNEMRTIKRSVFFVFSKRKRVMSKFCIYFVCTFNYDANLECNVVILLCEIGACWVQVLLSPTKWAIRGRSKGNNSLTLARNFELIKHRRSRVTNAPYKIS